MKVIQLLSPERDAYYAKVKARRQAQNAMRAKTPYSSTITAWTHSSNSTPMRSTTPWSGITPLSWSSAPSNSVNSLIR